MWKSKSNRNVEIQILKLKRLQTFLESSALSLSDRRCLHLRLLLLGGGGELVLEFVVDDVTHFRSLQSVLMMVFRWSSRAARRCSIEISMKGR